MDTPTHEAFTALLQRAAPRLLSIARRVAPRGTEPADLVQDTYERAWAARNSLDDLDRGEAWLCSILTHRARDLGRRAALRTEVGFTEEREPATPADLAEQLLAHERSDELRRALSELGPEATVSVVLVDGEGWTATEVAALLGASEASTHKRVQRARAQLATAMLAPSDRSRSPTGELCDSVHELARAQIDGELSADQERAVREHLDSCSYCPVNVRAVTSALTLLRAQGAVDERQLAALRQAARRS